MKLNRN